MKKITNYILICTCALGFSSCVNTFLDLEPLDAKTDVIYFKTPEHFREYANGLYGQLLGWQSSYGSIFDHMDAASDLSTCFRYSYGVGTGVMGVPNDDSRWGNCYGNIRATNHMFERAVSSYTGNLADIKKELKEGTTILFSGTPCQVAGLLSFLRKKPDNLLCVDFVCRGVPSPGLWDNYVKYMENKYSSKIVGARFKHKTYGYHTSTMKIDFANGKTYYGSGRVDPYMKAFVREISSRPSCAACAFKGIERPSDITVFDCYEYSKITGRKDDNRGYSSIFVHTEKGGKILEAIKSHIEIQEEDVNSLVTENGVMVCNSAKPHPRRAEFYQLAEHYPIDKALNKIDPITLKDKIIEKSKRFLFKTGLITVARHLNKGKKVEVVENK